MMYNTYTHYIASEYGPYVCKWILTSTHIGAIKNQQELLC